jgi:hypothetical protein
MAKMIRFMLNSIAQQSCCAGGLCLDCRRSGQSADFGPKQLPARPRTGSTTKRRSLAHSAIWRYKLKGRSGTNFAHFFLVHRLQRTRTLTPQSEPTC